MSNRPNEILDRFFHLIHETPEVDGIIGKDVAGIFKCNGIAQIKKFFIAIVMEFVIPETKNQSDPETWAEIWIDQYNENLYNVRYGIHGSSMDDSHYYSLIHGYNHRSDYDMNAFLILDQDCRRILIINNEFSATSIKIIIQDPSLKQVTDWYDLIDRYELDQLVICQNTDSLLFSKNRKAVSLFSHDLFPRIREGMQLKRELEEFAQNNDLPKPNISQLLRYRILVFDSFTSKESTPHIEMAKTVYDLPSKFL